VTARCRADQGLYSMVGYLLKAQAVLSAVVSIRPCGPPNSRRVSHATSEAYIPQDGKLYAATTRSRYADLFQSPIESKRTGIDNDSVSPNPKMASRHNNLDHTSSPTCCATDG
jgi:hypothetical protein